MSNGVRIFLEMLGFAIVIIILYNVARKYLLSKVKVNKWVILIAAILVFVLGGFLPQKNRFLNYIPSGVFVVLLLWFLDLQGWGAARYKKKLTKKNQVVIKPKAKPNRVKNNK